MPITYYVSTYFTDSRASLRYIMPSEFTSLNCRVTYHSAFTLCRYVVTYTWYTRYFRQIRRTATILR